MEKKEMLERLENLGVFEEDEDTPVVIGTENGLYVKGVKGKILTTITCMLKEMYDDGDLSKEDIEQICKLSTLDLNDTNEIVKLLEELKERLGE